MEYVICFAYSCYSFLLVYRLVTSMKTSIAFLGTIVPSTILMKCVVSFRYYFCSFIIGWRRLSTKDEILSVGPSHPEIIG